MGITSSGQPPFGITGATGYVGGAVAARLAARGVSQRLIVRDISRAPALPGAEAVEVAGYADTDGMTRALRGIHTLFLVSAAEAPDRLQQHFSAVDAALAAGVERIVYLSFLGAAPDAAFTLARQHYHTEARIRAGGVAFTFLRDSLYADSIPHFFGRDGIVRGPAGDGRVSCVARDDVADAAAAVLMSDQHNGKTYNNTGPEALTLAEIAALISEYAGRPLSYHEETMDEAWQSRAVYNAPDFMVEAWISTYTAIAEDELSLVTDDILRLTGHPAQSLGDFLRTHPESYAHLKAK
ncbi:MAG: SDR family oxidoreductase [Anaerolineae bacterium]|nr:SDR family oxidoreductase [Anaerolineae bacterium]